MYEVIKDFPARDQMGERIGIVYRKGEKVSFSPIEAARYSNFIKEIVSGPERAIKTPNEKRQKGGKNNG